MKPQKIQEAILAMLVQKIPIREISRVLKVSRSLIRRVKKEGTCTSKPAREQVHEDLDLIRQVFNNCKGNVVRVKEVLEAEHGLLIPYSTLTHMVREASFREPKPRAGRYVFGPGDEMQHDTSPHKLLIAGKHVIAQCAALVLTFSSMLFMQYYPCFTRFEALHFLQQAITFMGGGARRCVIDNTSVVLVAGSGANAQFATEMEAFGRFYGFAFFAHAIGHADRKAQVERSFHYAENNFLSGRTFSSWADLSQQAVTWCQVANAKEKRRLGMSPQAAWLMEKPHLEPLPALEWPICKPYPRIVDTSGYINLDTNRYSVPDRLLGKQLEVHKHMDRVCVYQGKRKVADHPRLIDQRDGRIVAPGHHQPLTKKHRETCDQELNLKGCHPDLDAYIKELKRRVRGRGVSQFNRLLGFKRSYPEDAFLGAVQHALHYSLFDLTRLENLILKRVAGDFFKFGGEWPCD